MSFASVLCVCMVLMHDFVKRRVYCISGKYTYLEASAYLICDARTKGCFGKLNFKMSNGFESLSKSSDFTPYLS